MNLAEQKLKQIGLSITEKDKEKGCYIKSVDVSGMKNKEKRCAITMVYSDSLDSIIFWSLDDKDIEIDSFDCSSKALIFYDSKGRDYILD